MLIRSGAHEIEWNERQGGREPGPEPRPASSITLPNSRQILILGRLSPAPLTPTFSLTLASPSLPPPVPCAAVFTAQGCVSQTSLRSVRRLPPLGPGGGAEMLMKVVVMVVMNIWRHVLMAGNTSTSCVNVSRICSFLKNQES